MNLKEGKKQEEKKEKGRKGRSEEKRKHSMTSQRLQEFIFGPVTWNNMNATLGRKSQEQKDKYHRTSLKCALLNS